MKTKIKNRILVGASLFAMMFGTASCVDNMGLQVTPEAPNADKTIFEIITNDSDLTNFINVLDACNMSDNARVVDSLFNQARVYTLWAPTNKALTKEISDSLIEKAKSGRVGREDVMTTFVKAHIANNLVAAKGAYKDAEGNDAPEMILMLNGKKVAFQGSYKPIDGYDTGYKFGENYLKSVNDRALNGIIHKLDETAKYRYNIWEALKYCPKIAGYRIDSVANFLYSHNQTEFNAGASILGPIVNSEQTYLDSVFVTSNKLLSVYNGVGSIDSEDSTYTIYIPTNDAWNTFLSKSKKHFNYDPTTKQKPDYADSAYIDSIKQLYPRINMLKYLTFSDNEQKNVEGDSIMPANRDRARRPRFVNTIFDGCVVGEYDGILSNGTIKVINKIPYTIFDLWHDTIKVQGEDDEMRVLATADNHYPKTIYKDQIRRDHLNYGSKLGGDVYYELYSDPKKAVAPSVTFRLPNVRSASYKIAIVTVPMDLTEKVELPDSEMDITYLSVMVKQGTETLFQTAMAQLNQERIDTLFLADESGKDKIITFPTCEYYNSYKNTDFVASLELTSWGLGDNYDLSLRIDEIILIPVDDAK